MSDKIGQIFPRPLRERGNVSFAKQTVKDLTSYRLNVLTTYKKTAYTLAEVLITLGIIGVVAAMTIPVLVQYHKRSVASSSIKKFVSTINQALIYAEADLGSRESWTIGTLNTSDSSYEFLNTYIKPYVRNLGIEKRTLFGWNMATLRFNDGSQMSVKVGTCYDIYFDINGEKLPNEEDRDIFKFILCRQKGHCNLPTNNMQAFWCSNNSVKPTRAELIEKCKRSNGGGYCTLLLEENQYEFPKDYPKRL